MPIDLEAKLHELEQEYKELKDLLQQAMAAGNQTDKDHINERLKANQEAQTAFAKMIHDKEQQENGGIGKQTRSSPRSRTRIATTYGEECILTGEPLATCELCQIFPKREGRKKFVKRFPDRSEEDMNGPANVLLLHKCLNDAVDLYGTPYLAFKSTETHGEYTAVVGNPGLIPREYDGKKVKLAADPKILEALLAKVMEVKQLREKDREDEEQNGNSDGSKKKKPGRGGSPPPGDSGSRKTTKKTTSRHDSKTGSKRRRDQNDDAAAREPLTTLNLAIHDAWCPYLSDVQVH